MSLIRKFTLYDANGRELELTSNSNVPVETVENGHICVDNTTSTLLGGGAVFTGSWQDTLNYNVIIIGINTDKASAVDGLDVQWSCDGITVNDHDYFTLLANQNKVFTFSPARRYFRIIYTNGPVAQTTFCIQSVFKKGGFKPSSHRISDSIVNDDDAELVKAVLTGENPGGDFINFSATNGGNFKVSIEELESGVSVNSNSQLKVTPFDSSGDEIIPADYTTQQTIKAILDAIQSLNETMTEFMSRIAFLEGIRGVAADLRVTPLSLPTLSAVTTVSTVTNQTNIGGIPAQTQIPCLQNITAQSNINNVS